MGVLDTTTAMVWDIMDTVPMDMDSPTPMVMATTMESALLTPNPLRPPLLLLMPTPSTATTDTVWPTTATDTVWPTTDTDTVWPTMVTMDTLMPTTATTARGPLPLMPMPSTATTGMLTTDTDTDTATLTVDITATPMPTTDTMATARSNHLIYLKFCQELRSC